MNSDIITLSIIQGISEILPVSSSVNLYLFSKLFHIDHFNFSLKVALHAGSLITLLIYFRKEILDIILALFGKKTVNETYLLPLVLGTIPVVIFGYYSRDFVKEFDSPKVMGILSIVFGILLVLFDNFAGISKTPKSEKKTVSVIKSLIIGCCQTIAVFPGVSRLGICITSSRMLGIARRKAITFSLMLAIPSISGSLCLELLETYKNTNSVSFSNDELIGIGITTLIGLIAIIPCIHFMEKVGFLWLAIYRVIIGLTICFF